MQQIAVFDQELNYTPYRYRHRSNTNPKKKSNDSHSYSYSRGKKQKYNPEKVHWEHAIPALEFIPRNKMNIYESIQTQRQRERCQDGEEQECQKIEETVMNDSQLQIRQANQQQLNIKENEQSEEASPIKRIQKQRLQFPVKALQKPTYEESIQQSEKAEVSSPQKMSSIFNESDVREFKENILNNIRHADSQKQLEIEQQQFNLKQDNPVVSQHSQIQQGMQQQKINFDARYQRIRAINQHYEQNQEFNRNLKRREMSKKVKKIKAQQLNTKLKTIINDNGQHLSKLIYNQQKHHIATIVNNVQYEPNSYKSQLTVSHVIKKQMKVSQTQKQIVSCTRQTERQRQVCLNSQNTSIRTTNSSYAKQRQEKAKVPQILTFDKYKQKMKAKEPSFDRNNIENKSTSLKKNQLHLQQQKIAVAHPQKAEAKQQNIIQCPKEAESPIASSDILSQFTKFDSSKVIAELREARSKGKQQSIKQLPTSNAVSSYSAKPLLTSSYKSKHLQAGQTYAINMKKKKQKKSSKAPQKYTISQISPIKGHLDRIQQQTYSIQDQQSLKEPSHLPLQQNVQSHIQIGYNQEQLAKESAQQSGEYFKLVQQDLIQLQEGIAGFLNAQQEINNSNKKCSRESSHPTSRVYERLNVQELKSEDGEQLLKIMAVNTNFKQLSSLVIEDRSPEHQDSQLISQQLCQIINSNQSELSASPTPQSVSLSSSLRYRFEQEEREAYQNDKSEMDASGTLPEGSALIQINEDSRVFFEKLGLCTEPLITPDLLQQPQETLYIEQPKKLQSQANQLSRQTSSRKSMQAQTGGSLHEYKSHFHPSAAIRKFKHAKHNSADFQQKSLKSARMSHHSLSTIRHNMLSLESCERIKTRLQRNKTRFRSKYTDN